MAVSQVSAEARSTDIHRIRIGRKATSCGVQ